MGPHRPLADGLYLQLWPDWSAWRSPGFARFSAIVKVGAGFAVDGPATIELRMLDVRKSVVATEASTFSPSSGRLVGPAWELIHGGFVTLDEAVTHVEGELGGAVSERVARRELDLPVVLKPVMGELGLAGEPRLWWCYRNLNAGPVGATAVLRSRTLWVDGRALAVPPGAYNGPTDLPAQRALSGWWSLDELGVDSRTSHTFALEILGQRSEEFACAWATTS